MFDERLSPELDAGPEIDGQSPPVDADGSPPVGDVDGESRHAEVSRVEVNELVVAVEAGELEGVITVGVVVQVLCPAQDEMNKGGFLAMTRYHLETTWTISGEDQSGET